MVRPEIVAGLMQGVLKAHALRCFLVCALLGLAVYPAYAEEAEDAARRGLARLAASDAAPALPADAAGETPVPRPETGMHTAAINRAVVTADGRLLTVSDDKTARLWRLDTRGLGRPAADGDSRVLRVPIGVRNEGKLYAVAVSPLKNRAVMAGSTGLAGDASASVYYVVDLASGNILAGVPAVPGSVRVLSYSRDGRFLAIGSGQGWLRVIDLENREKPTAMFDTADSACGDELTAAQFLGDGRLVTACLDGQLRLYDASFQLVKTYRFPAKHRPWRLALSPDEDKLAVGSQAEAAVALFSLGDLKLLPPLKGDARKRGNLSVLAWVGDTIFAAGTYGDQQGVKYLRAWNSVSGQAKELPLADDTVNDLTPLPDGRLAYVTAQPGIGVVDTATLGITRQYNPNIADFRDAFEGTFAVSADGATVAFGLTQGGRSPMMFDFSRRSLTAGAPTRSDLFKPVLPAALRNWRNSPHPTLAGKPLALSQNERSLSAASAKDGSALIGGDYSLQLWRGGLQRWNIDVPGPAWAVNLTPDGKLALAALGDGTIRWYDAASGRELLALFVTTDSRWLVWNPDGYFDHSEGAAYLIGYHLNQGKAATPRFVLSGQMHGRFYRPDILGAAVLPSGSAATQAQAGNVHDVVTQRRAPTVRLLAWCAAGKCSDFASDSEELPALTVDVPELTLRFGLEDQGSGIGGLLLRRNQATVATRGLGRLAAASQPNATESAPTVVERTVVLEAGDNLITATAFDAEQTVDSGDSVRLPVHYQAAAMDAPTLRILSIGIDQYRSPALPKLKNAVSDARGIAERLAANPQNMFGTVSSIVLLDAQADLAHIRQALNEIVRQAKADDVVVLFLAGHGQRIEGKYAFLPYDVDFSSDKTAEATALTQDLLTDSISSLPASRMAVLIDSCYAGALAVQDSVFQNRKWTGSMAQNTGRFILAGASSEQEALDGIEGHGVFTAVVLEGLNGKADQEVRGNRDQYVDVVEILEYTRKRVSEEAHKVSHNQNATPFFSGNDFFNLTISR